MALQSIVAMVLMCSIKRAMYVPFADIYAQTLALMPAQPPRDLAGQVIPVRFIPDWDGLLVLTRFALMQVRIV